MAAETGLRRTSRLAIVYASKRPPQWGHFDEILQRRSFGQLFSYLRPHLLHVTIMTCRALFSATFFSILVLLTPNFFNMGVPSYYMFLSRMYRNPLLSIAMEDVAPTVCSQCMKVVIVPLTLTFRIASLVWSMM